MPGQGRLCLPVALLLCWGALPVGLYAGNPDRWIPVRWDGGPLELSRRTRARTLPEKPGARAALGGWYDPATLSLLEGTPVNCILVTLSIGADAEIEQQQARLVRAYAGVAHARSLAVLGIVYPGADASRTAASAAAANLDGVVLEGDFSAAPDFAVRLAGALNALHCPIRIIPIARHPAAVRTSSEPLLAIEGVRPSARDLADMGIRAGASAEPWIESNIWLVRSFRLENSWRPIWINQQPNPNAKADYLQCVADSAVAGGQWLVALDDDLRAGLYQRDPTALATWRGIASYLQFAQEHAEWRRFEPYGNLGVILDTGARDAESSDEYLNLVARREVPYRLLRRSALSSKSLADFQAVLAIAVAPPTEAERRILREFAEQGGMVITGPSWSDAPKDDPYTEIPLGKGRIIVYKEDPPDPEAVARDLLELLSPEMMGVNVFNVASAITYASTADSGKRVLVQLLNYAGTPTARVTIRCSGTYKTAHLYTPEGAPAELTARPASNGRTEVTIPKLGVWAAVMLE